MPMFIVSFLRGECMQYKEAWLLDNLGILQKDINRYESNCQRRSWYPRKENLD